MIPPGLEPGTLCVLGTRDNHYTTESKRNMKLYDTQNLNVSHGRENVARSFKKWLAATNVFKEGQKSGARQKKATRGEIFSAVWAARLQS